MRRQSSPHHLSCQAQAIQQFGIIARDSARKDSGLPGGSRNLIALKLAQDLVQAVHTMQLSARRKVLPPAQKAHEIRGGHRLNFLAQAA